MTDRSPNSETDLALFEQIKLRNKSAYESFYKKHYRFFYALAYNYLRKHEISEEIVNDVFINIWTKASELTINQSFKSYVGRAVINASLNYLKKEKLELEKQEKYSQWNVEDAETEEDTDQKELILVKLEKAVELLPPQCKKVMIMSRFDKMRQQDIADTLNISIKTVKNHLTYGFGKIRDILAQDGILLSWVIIAYISSLLNI